MCTYFAQYHIIIYYYNKLRFNAVPVLLTNTTMLSDTDLHPKVHFVMMICYHRLSALHSQAVTESKQLLSN